MESSSLPQESQNQHLQQQQPEAQNPSSSQQFDPSTPQTQSTHDQSQHSQQPQHNSSSSSSPQFVPSHSQLQPTGDQSQQPQQFHDQQQQPQFQISEAPLPGVEIAPVGLSPGEIQVQHPQNPYFPQTNGAPLDLGIPGLNPAAAAAVAALSQLTQLAGNMGDVERVVAGLQEYVMTAAGYGPMLAGGIPGPFVGSGPMQYSGPLIGQPPYRGRGRRGGRHRNFGNHGRGCGRGRVIPGHYSPEGTSAHQKTDMAEAADSMGEVAQTSADNSDNAAQAEMAYQTSIPAKSNSAFAQQHNRAASCELCRVECTTLEVLEQHKGGKKHKKNLQKLEMQKAKYTQNGEENKVILSQRLPGEATSDGTEQKENQGQPQNPGEEQSYMQGMQTGGNNFGNQRTGMKRKMKGGHGGKRMKTSKQTAVPLICDLCNVKCDTQEVFDRHLSGKKHIAKYKRFEGHQAMYGQVGLQVLYPPNPISQTLSQPQDHQQTLYGGPQGAVIPSATHNAPQVQPAEAAITATRSSFQQNLS